MKTERRHELQANQLAEFLTDVGEKTKPYATMILGLALAALVIVGVYFYLSKSAKSEEGLSWQEAMQAANSGDAEGLRSVVANYPNKPAALWSQLILADRELNDGVNRLFTQKSAGRDLIRTAADDYQNVAERAVQPMLIEHALYGLGRSQESLDQLSKAHEAYDRLLKDYPSGAYAERARRRIEELDRDSTKEWYDWFAKTEPTPANLDKGTGTNPFDQKGPSFDVPDLPKSKTPPPEPKPDDSKAKSDDAKTAPADSKSKADDSKLKSDEPKPKADEPKADKAEPAKSDAPKSAPPKTNASSDKTPKAASDSTSPAK
jgi:tetratricopeptide (TPR) repeat protein